MNIEISALGPSISEQCAVHNFTSHGLPMTMVDRISSALTLEHIHGILTDREIDRARLRLIKTAKFGPVA